MHDFINLMGDLMAYGLAAFGMLFLPAKMEAAEARYFERRRRENNNDTRIVFWSRSHGNTDMEGKQGDDVAIYF